MRRATRVLLAAAASCGLLLAAATSAAGGTRLAPASNTGSATFLCTGGEQVYSVPATVSALRIAAVGAPGGGLGGNGASVTATVPIASGTQKVYVEVGCAGSSSDGSGGFNGGGSTSQYAGGGGGASDVRLQPMTTPLTTTDSRLVVAGGGGGGGGCQPAFGGSGAAGGVGGDAKVTGAGNGGPGAPGEDVSCSGATAGGNGGFGGTTGGTGAPGTACLTFAGGDGSIGQGGGGGSDPNAFNGAGGGGYYGGGGGGDGCSAGGGGGAGSSFWIDGATKTSMNMDTTGKPKVVITPLAEDSWTAAANKAWSASSPKTRFVSTAATITCTTNTASGPSAGSGPDIGALTMNAPKFSNCKDGLGDPATVTTKSSGWTVSFISDSGNAKCPAGTGTDETSGGDCVVLGVPKAAATIVLGGVKACTITVQPKGPTKVGAKLTDPGGTNKDKIVMSSQPLSYKGCGVLSGTAKFTGTYTLQSPHSGVLVDTS